MWWIWLLVALGISASLGCSALILLVLASSCDTDDD